jgi:hypothetical protein
MQSPLGNELQASAPLDLSSVASVRRHGKEGPRSSAMREGDGLSTELHEGREGSSC